MRPGVRAYLLCLVVLLISLGLLALGVVALAAGDVGIALFEIVAGLLVLGVAVWGAGERGVLARRPRVERRTLTGDDGGPAALVVPYRGSMAGAALLAFVAMLLLAALLVAVGVTSLDGGGSGAIVIGVVGLAGAGYMLLTLAQVGTGRLRRGYLALTPQGVVLRSWTYAVEVGWDELAVPVQGDGRRLMLPTASPPTVRRASRLWTEPAFRFLPRRVVIDLRYLAADPERIRAILDRCGNDPSVRALLGSDRGEELARDIAPR